MPPSPAPTRRSSATTTASTPCATPSTPPARSGHPCSERRPPDAVADRRPLAAARASSRHLPPGHLERVVGGRPRRAVRCLRRQRRRRHRAALLRYRERPDPDRPRPQRACPLVLGPADTAW